MSTFYNKATLSYNGVVTTSNTTAGQLTEILELTKTSLTADYYSNDNLTFVISIVNSGTTAYTGLTVTDNLGSYTYNTLTLVPLSYVSGTLLYYVNGSLAATPTITSASPLTISGISVPASGNAILIYQAQTNEYAPPDVGSTITNTVTVTGTGLQNALTATETVTAGNDPTLTVSKSLTPTTVSTNDTVTYTFIIENIGNTAADTSADIVISDTFNPVLGNLSVSFNGTAWTAGTQYTYDSTTGVFTGNTGYMTVPAATYTQNTTTGEWTVVPGTSTLIITGTI